MMSDKRKEAQRSKKHTSKIRVLLCLINAYFLSLCKKIIIYNDLLLSCLYFWSR